MDFSSLDPAIASQFDWGNFDDHSSRTKIVNIVVVGTTSLVVVVRTILRCGTIRKLAADDVLIIVAAICQIGFSGEVIYALQFGLGKHVWLASTSFSEDIPYVRRIIEVLFFANMTYFTSITLAKLSIITCYFRVFPNITMRRVCAGLAFLVASTWLCSILTTTFTCKRISDQWEFDNMDRQCIQIIPFYYFAASTNAFTDIALTVAPVPLLRRIKVPKKEKFLLCALFGMGLFVGACSVMRLLSLRDLYNVDISFSASDTLDWSTTELGVGIFCASVPSLKPLLRCLRRKNERKLYHLPTIHQPKAITSQLNGRNRFEMLNPSQDMSKNMGNHVEISSIARPAATQSSTSGRGTAAAGGQDYSTEEMGHYLRIDDEDEIGRAI